MVRNNTSNLTFSIFKFNKVASIHNRQARRYCLDTAANRPTFAAFDGT